MRKFWNKNKSNRAQSVSLKPLISALRNPRTPSTSRLIRFESLEPRVLLSGDTNPTALTVNGAIDLPGETDTYGFVLNADSNIVFDSLTSNSSINWSLTGPRGVEIANRSFSSSDSANLSTSPILNLVAGEYTLTADGVADATGSYGFRLLDMNRATKLLPGEQVRGQLSPANETDAYQFSAAAGDKFSFQSRVIDGAQPTWRLLDPYGKNVFGPTSLGSVDIYLSQIRTPTKDRKLR